MTPEEKEQAAADARRYLKWDDEVAVRPKPTQAPCAPLGPRVMLRDRPLPDATETGMLFIPDDAKQRSFEGMIIAAGDQASDVLFSKCVEPGDRVLRGANTGLYETWDHFIGKEPDCDHADGDRPCWWWLDDGVDGRKSMICEKCKVIRVIEPLIICNVSDLLADIDLQVRIESGEVIRRMDTDQDGRPYFLTEYTNEKRDGRTWGLAPAALKEKKDAA